MVKKRPGTDEAFLERDPSTDLTMVIEPTDDDHGSDRQDEGPSSVQVDGSEHPREYALVVRKGQQKGRTWLLSPGVTRVGRHPYSDIALDHITVSRRHCRISLDGTGLSIEDLGSTNGCYVNDCLVEKTPLKAGDRLMIGTFHLLVARGR